MIPTAMEVASPATIYIVRGVEQQGNKADNVQNCTTPKNPTNNAAHMLPVRTLILHEKKS